MAAQGGKAVTKSTSNKPDIQVLPLKNANQEQINSDQPVLEVIGKGKGSSTPDVRSQQSGDNASQSSIKEERSNKDGVQSTSTGTGYQRGDKFGPNKNNHGRSGNNKASRGPEEEGQPSGDDAIQNKTKNEKGEKETDDRTKSGAKPDQKPHTTSLYVKQTENKGLDNLAKSMPPAVNPPESGSDRENLDVKIATMKDLLGKREKELEEKDATIRDTEETNNRLQRKSDEDREIIKTLREEMKRNEDTMKSYITKLGQELEDRNETITLLNGNIEKLSRKHHEEKKKNKQMTEDFESERRSMREIIDKLTAEKNDLSKRYSQVASAQLKDNNPNIVDLSDPNRAMKLGERFGELYSDAWTDAYEALQNLKIPDRDAIQNLLDVLKKSYDFCQRLAGDQLEGLSNLLLFPCQDPEQQVNKGKGGLNIPRIQTSNRKALLELRRQVVTIDGVKQAFLSHMHKEEEDKNVMEASKAYYVKCVEICWLMVLHDPPLHMVMDVEPGSKYDPNLFTILSKGDKVEYLVWPPLLNGKGGGLLQKGVVEVIKSGNKKGPKTK